MIQSILIERVVGGYFARAVGRAAKLAGLRSSAIPQITALAKPARVHDVAVFASLGLHDADDVSAPASRLPPLSR